jgi:hypothetical protein
MVCVARENDHGAGRIGLQLARVELISKADIKYAGNYRVDAILGVLVWHELGAVGRSDSDGVRPGLGGLTHDDGQADRRWECRKCFPIDIVGQDSFENVLTQLVGLGFDLLGKLNDAGFLRHKTSFVTDHGIQSKVAIKIL